LETDVESVVKTALDALRRETGSDFSSLALIEPAELRTKWKWASGNLNERYLNMSARRGRGLAGEIVKVGRGIVWSKADLEKLRPLPDYSILNAERLMSAYAVPVAAGGEVAGVLLVGGRDERAYGQEDKQIVAKAAERIALFLPDLL